MSACSLPPFLGKPCLFLVFTHKFQMVISKMPYISVVWLLNKQNSGFLLGKHSSTRIKPWLNTSGSIPAPKGSHSLCASQTVSTVMCDALPSKVKPRCKLFVSCISDTFCAHHKKMEIMVPASVQHNIFLAKEGKQKRQCGLIWACKLGDLFFGWALYMLISNRKSRKGHKQKAT